MRVIVVLALVAIGLIVSSIAALIPKGGSFETTQGEVRCESPGAVVINIAGEDYAVNTIAGWRYPPVQLVWNTPETDIERLTVRGLALCNQ
jgi:hypothetical protein